MRVPFHQTNQGVPSFSLARMYSIAAARVSSLGVV
jgi:hypothetical protein